MAYDNKKENDYIIISDEDINETIEENNVIDNTDITILSDDIASASLTEATQSFLRDLQAMISQDLNLDLMDFMHTNSECGILTI